MKKSLSLSIIVLCLLTLFVGPVIWAKTDDRDVTNTPKPVRPVGPVDLNPLQKRNPDTSEQSNKSLTKEYSEIKETYLKSVATYEQGRQDFLKAREQASKLPSAENEEKLLESAKKHLKNSLETIIRHLEVLKTRVENVPGIDEELKNSLLAEIDSDISYLQAQLESIDEISSLAQIREFGKTVKEYWLKVRSHSKRIVGHILAARIRHFRERLKTLSDEARSEMTSLKSSGIDTTEVEALLADFDQNLALAEEKYRAAVEVFQSISNVEEAQDLFIKGHDLVKEGHQYLRGAHTNLKEALKKLKELMSAGE